MTNLRQLVLWAGMAMGFLGWCNAAASDATTGTLFGYTIGDSYPVSEGTEIVSRSPAPGRLITLVAENPVKPDDIDRVLLVTTPFSHAILIVGVQQGFPDEASAREFGRRYLHLLAARYPGSSADLEVMDRRGRLVFGDDYELVMTLLEGDQVNLVDAPWVIEMLYQSRSGSSSARELAERLQADIDALTLREDSRGL